jgi:hypothetical protein
MILANLKDRTPYTHKYIYLFNFSIFFFLLCQNVHIIISDTITLAVSPLYIYKYILRVP